MVMLRRFLALGAVALAGLTLAGCDQGDAVAYVNGSAISQDDYFSLLEMNRTNPSMTAGQATLNQLVQQRLLVQEARHEGVAPTEEELQASMVEFRNNPAVQEEISKSGLTEQQIIRLFIEPNMSIVRLYAKMAGVKDPDVQKYFSQHKAEFKQPEQVRARILQVADKKKADDAMALVGKSTFEAIIQTVGGAAPPTGGDPNQIQTLQKDGVSPYPKPVVDAAFATAKGQASKIIEAAPPPNFLQPQAAPQGKQYFIVYVEDKVAAKEPDLKNPSVKDQVLQAVAREKSTSLSPSAIQDLVTRLRQAASVSVVRPAVKSVEKPPPPQPSQVAPGGAPPASAPAPQPTRPTTTVKPAPSTAQPTAPR